MNYCQSTAAEKWLAFQYSPSVKEQEHDNQKTIEDLLNQAISNPSRETKTEDVLGPNCLEPNPPFVFTSNSFSNQKATSKWSERKAHWTFKWQTLEISKRNLKPEDLLPLEELLCMAIDLFYPIKIETINVVDMTDQQMEHQRDDDKIPRK